MNNPRKRKQDYLLELIQTLNPNERRYFKLYSNIQPGEKRYLRLFEALESKTAYNVEELCMELELSASQLADEKYYLNQVLLRSLRNFDDEAQLVSGIYNALAEARSVYNRGLYSYALSQVEKILSKAIRLEMYNVTLDVITLKQTCLRRLSKFGELQKLNEENKMLRARYDEFFEMTQLSFAISELEQRRGKAAEAKQLLKQPIFKKRPKGLRTFIVWFNLKCYEHILVHGNPKKWVAFVRDCVKYGAQQPQLLEINPLGYLYMYTDLASAEMGTGNYEEAIKVCDKLLKLLKVPVTSVPKGEIESAALFTLYLKAYALRHLKRYSEACEIAKQIYEQRNQRNVYDQFSFTFEYIIDLLHCNKAAVAVDLINELLQINTDARSDYQQALRVIIIMAQIDLGNFDLVPYLVKSARIWLKRNKKEHKEYILFFSLVLNIAKANNEPAVKEAYIKMGKLLTDKKLPELDYELDLKGWLQNHLKNIRIKENSA